LVYLSTALIVEIYTDHYVTRIVIIANLALVWNLSADNSINPASVLSRTERRGQIPDQTTM